MKCAVKDCYNHTQDGGFIDSLCAPCYNFAIGEGGTRSQAYRNSKKTFTELIVRECAGLCSDPVVVLQHWGLDSKSE